MVRKIAWGVLVFLILILLFIVSAIAPIDESPLDTFDAINTTSERVKELKLTPNMGEDSIQVGWASINITPQTPIDMAGYGPRGPYTSVADSLFARAVVLSNGAHEVVIISLDLLMFPRFVKSEIQEALKEYGFSPPDIFLSATHTHNAFGNWEQSAAGEFIFGDFNQGNVAFLVNQILTCVEDALANTSKAQIGFQKIDANELVVNRLAPKTGSKDPYLRVISLLKANGKKGVITSFSGHAVNLDADIWEINRDYPGVLVDQLERDPTIDFAMFCAGMVASHNIASTFPKGNERILTTGQVLADKIINQQDSLPYSSNSAMSALDIEIGLPPSQLRISKKLRLRDWIFRAFLGPLQANIKVLAIGDILMIGMPCDFSGELSVNNQLDQFAADHGKELFITSFNGNYIGYITEDAHYATCDHDEVKSLNWVGPFKGAYFTQIIKNIIEASGS